MAGRCGCRTDTAQDVYIHSAGRGGLGSSSQAAIGDGDEDDTARLSELIALAEVGL